MSRIPKWKLEKTKVKVVFRLQFHATHIPQTGWDKLFISFIPSDSGKATAKTTKANVRNGTCKWADPIYETTRLLQDVKSKQYDEKLYKLVVSMGSSRASILGEATINLADYADASKPSSVSLPLHACNFGTVLHVTVQLLTSKTGFREFEQQRDLRERGLQSGVESKHDDSSPGKETASTQLDKVNARVRFKDAKKPSSFEEEAGSHEECADSALGCDDSSNTSESLYAEKHDSSSAHEIESLRSTVSGDLNGLHCQILQTEKVDLSDNPLMVDSASNSAHRWPKDFSIDSDLATVFEENHKLRGSLELAESTIVELKQEISSLQSQANEIGIETQKFSHFLACEISSSEEMAKEVSLMKSECLKLKDEIERLTNFKMNTQVTGEEDSHTLHHLLQDRQLRWLNGILNLENRIRVLQQKTYLGLHESDIRFIHSELEGLLRILQDIKQGTGEATSLLEIMPLERTDIDEIRGIGFSKNEQLSSGVPELDLDLSLPDSLLHHLSIPPLISQETDPVGGIDVMKRKIFDLTRELDEAKTGRDSLARKMDQMECYYEALIQELEENQKQMMGELQNLRNEHSTCVYTISASKAEMELMHQNMSQQLIQLAEERSDLDALNKELERRASTSEAALRRARLNYSIAVDKLQKDLELLSSQVVSMFETNENLIKQSFPESPQRKNRRYFDMFQNPEDSEDASLVQCQNPNAGFRKQPLGGDILLEDLKKSLYLQEELYQKVEGELHEMQFVNLHLDIFSNTLQETLFEANAEIGHMKGNLDELAQRLELSNAAQDQLIIRLQAAMEDVHLLNDYKASCIPKFSDMALENHTLGGKLEIFTKENSLLVEKVADYEAISSENRNYQKKYEACVAEKAELSKLLKQENADNVKLQNDISLLKEELKTSKAEVDEFAFLKDNLQEDVSFVQDKLASMLTSYGQQFKGLNLLDNSRYLDLEADNIRSTVLQLERMQNNGYNKMLELMEEKRTLDVERVFSVTSLNSARSDILAIKQNFRGDIHKLAAKIDVSNALVGKLQVDLESVANKLDLSSKVEEKYAQQNNDVLADLALFEVELQKLTSENGLLSQEILGLEELAEELGMSKSTIADLLQEKQGLLMSVQDKIQESINLASERDSLTENLRSLHHELLEERTSKEKLDDAVRDLTVQLNIMQKKLLEYDQQQSELVHLRQLLQDLESENSRLNHVLLLNDDHLVKLQEESSCLNHLQAQLLEMDDYMLAADVKFTFILNQYETVYQEFGQRIKSSEGCLEELQERHQEGEAMLNQSLVSEARYREENAELTRMVESLQSDLQASVVQNKSCSEENDVFRIQLEEYKTKLKALEDGYNKDKHHHVLQVEEIRNLLANAKEENIKLVSTVESLQSDLEASVTQNKFSSKANDDIRVQLEEYKMKLEVLEDGYNKDRDHHALQVEQLRNLLAKAEEENIKLMNTVESLRSDLEASAAQNKFASEANDDVRVQLEGYKKKLEALEDGYNKDKDCHARQVEQLKNLLANAEEEKIKLMSTIESLQSDLEASVAGNKFTSEANDDIKVQLEEYKKKFEALEHGYNKDKDHHALQVGQLRHSLVNAEEENGKLMRTVKSLQSDLEASAAQNTFSSETSDDIRVQLEEYKKKFEILEDGYNKDKDHHAVQVEQLRNLLAAAEVENDFLISSMEELDITLVVLKGKLDEQSAGITLIKEYKDEIVILQSKCTELTRKLSEQALKTDEFKNLSIHLKELKDKAEAECLQVREKREPEGSPVVQESLRIAFIKEQYETKVQELRQQLSISKKHGEELLFKFQDAIDEIEKRKRSEALHLKRNEELSLKFAEMEADLHSALSGKCEVINECDRLKAELECAVLTLECCKEEKEKLEASLRECQEENNKIAIELTSAKGDMENVASSIEIHKEENGGGMNNARHVSDESTGNLLPHFLNKETSVYRQKVEHVSSIQDDDCEDSSVASNGQADQEAAIEGLRGLNDDALLGGTLQLTDEKPLDLSKAHFNKNNFRSSMEHLHEELERMKHENSLLPMDPHSDPDFRVLKADLMRLQNANEELRNIFPFFDEISSSGNALERVLALEIELAESLRAKSKSIIHFQSSFLKQHSDEEAVLKSFRDINELIKEMLDLKGRYAALETELKEMHDRYSQLSLQFAEVEGERQKLKMTLKNVRASKKLQLNQSSSAAIADESP